MNRCKLLFVTLIVTIILMVSVSFAANPKVQINGEIIDFTDSAGNKVEAQIINNRTMVPLRKIFEVLECNVDWEDSTKTITATKGSKTIILQIGNKIASYKDSETNEDKSITLDSEPVIVSNRTLVPFRFIGESLGMEVAWDAGNSTAIIIDYDALAQILREKSRNFYEYGFGDNITISEAYYDELNSDNNYNTSISIRSSGYDRDQIVNIKVAGNSEFAKESENEEWNDFSFTTNESGEILTSNYVFSKIIGTEKNVKTVIDYTDYSLSANTVFELKDWIKELSVIDNNKITVNTYSELKKEWNKFADAFLSKGQRKLESNNFIYTMIDINKLLTQRANSHAFNTVLLLNQVMFKYNLNIDDLLSDYPDATYSFTEEAEGIEIKVILKNEYKEKIEYEFKFHTQNVI